MSYYERRLPHWQPEGAALFITWRLYGTLPQQPERIGTPSSGRVFAALDRELAAATSGPLWLKDERVARCVAEALRFGEEELRLYERHAWVIMANHVHVLIQPSAALARITKAIKNYTARLANEILARKDEPFWQRESFDRWVRDRQEFEKIAKYIEFNPVAAGLVESPGDWRWSSAYEGSQDNVR